MRIQVSSGWGDAVPGGYNGSLIAVHDGSRSAAWNTRRPTTTPVQDRDAEDLPGVQGWGIGGGLLKAAMRESPGPVTPAG